MGQEKKSLINYKNFLLLKYPKEYYYGTNVISITSHQGPEEWAVQLVHLPLQKDSKNANIIISYVVQRGNILHIS